MARPRKNPKLTTAVTNELLQQLLFVGTVLKDQGTPNETHILLTNGYAIAFNKILATGTKINSSIFAAPNYSLLVAALSKCSEEYNIVPLDNFGKDPFPTGLAINSGKFKAIVSCIDPILINVTHVDGNTIPISDEFKIALGAVDGLVTETGELIHTNSILLNGQSVVTTENGVMLFEYWHGFDLPTNISIPKSLATALSKINKKLIGFGYSQTSVTFHYEDGSFIRSQVFKEEWPDVGRILNVQSNPFETPKDLWEGLQAVSPHSINGLVYFDNGILHSHNDINVGASYEVKGLPKGPIFNIKQLQFIKNYAKQIDFFCHGPNGLMTAFYGDKCRGVIAGRTS